MFVVCAGQCSHNTDIAGSMYRRYVRGLLRRFFERLKPGRRTWTLKCGSKRRAGNENHSLSGSDQSPALRRREPEQVSTVLRSVSPVSKDDEQRSRKNKEFHVGHSNLGPLPVF